jgi:hypothetical protein
VSVSSPYARMTARSADSTAAVHITAAGPPADTSGMCARFTLGNRLNLVAQELAELLLDAGGLDGWDPPPACNVCPTQRVAAAR